MQTAFISGLLIDGSGRPPLERAVLLTEGGRITRVASMDEMREDARNWKNVVDCTGTVLMPGMIDAHVLAAEGVKRTLKPGPGVELAPDLEARFPFIEGNCCPEVMR
jgi:imidazolonepropionase-like amidohydrolase